jgi:hypothetical protein
VHRAGSLPARPNFANGCHICEVDPDTGKVEIARTTAADDSGVIINPPLIVDDAAIIRYNFCEPSEDQKHRADHYKGRLPACPSRSVFLLPSQRCSF